MKLPWKVAYKPLFEEWDPKSGPRIVDADGEFLFSMPQSEGVGHPGLYDEKADKLAHLIVEAVNYLPEKRFIQITTQNNAKENNVNEIYLIVENVSDSLGDVEEHVVFQCGFFTDAAVAERQTERLNQKHRLQIVDGLEGDVDEQDFETLKKLALDDKDIYPLLDEMVLYGLLNTPEQHDEMEMKLTRYGYITMLKGRDYVEPGRTF